MTNPAEQVMRVRIDYEGYFNALDLGEILVCLDGIYDQLLYSAYPAYRALPGARAARLRLRSLHSGSFVIDLATGVTQVIESLDPMVRATIAGLPALATLAKITKDAADWALDFRGRIRTQDFEARSREFELAERQLDLDERRRALLGPMTGELRELRSSVNSTHAETTNVPVHQGHDLEEAGDAIGRDRARLEEVIVRSTITAVTTELLSGEPLLEADVDGPVQND
ncbi:hypothetical protein [Paractinoplanes brasiliensis]|uniref:Uncharacterized protein n=1 Tax=Paractinoplanes brasiliensis TaxID=52695 RepID=A0A4R6J9W5_9ACTN|nr:hypothetical protein [Actinoplanes brasiliensis]TDO32282.1 hypothetical protein C8E87_7738 [Actinoplanes brasiliensis]GID27850.1 hypothetical protein Abr02nite_28330 [Actinoplanes brasiliensis]